MNEMIGLGILKSAIDYTGIYCPCINKCKEYPFLCVDCELNANRKISYYKKPISDSAYVWSSR